MLRQSLALFLVLTLVSLMVGCAGERKVYRIEPSRIPNLSAEQIVGVTTARAEEVSFDAPGGRWSADKITAQVRGQAYEIPMRDVQRVWISRQEVSKARTIGLITAIAVGTLVATVGIIAATKGSCPFIYSWDGRQYTFDAEPYGGAISRGLEKDDYTPLDHLRADKGVYRLKITNEVDETQLTNFAELWLLDHPEGSRVLADPAGRLHTVESVSPLLAARDRAGHDLVPWLKSTDRLIWEPLPELGADQILQDEIILTFPKPPSAAKAKLVLNASTGMWGSYMIKKMVALHGKDLPKWYQAMDQSAAARERLFNWDLSEELYFLKLYVEEPGGWEVRGILPGTGPYISKDRVVTLDVSRVRGDELRIRLRPTAGFWAFDSFGVDYSENREIDMARVPLRAATDNSGRSVRRELAGVDSVYYVMPKIGDAGHWTFDAPAVPPGRKRSIVLHTRGYYLLHIPTDAEPDTRTLQEFESVPGSAARFAAIRFGEWQSGRDRP